MDFCNRLSVKKPLEKSDKYDFVIQVLHRYYDFYLYIN